MPRQQRQRQGGCVGSDLDDEGLTGGDPRQVFDEMPNVNCKKIQNFYLTVSILADTKGVLVFMEAVEVRLHLV